MADIPMTLGVGDPLTGPRAESWRVEMLALDGTPLGTLDGVDSLSLDWSASRNIRGTGSLTWAGPSAAPDWRTVRLQPWYSARFPDGTTTEWPLGVFLPSTPNAKWADGSQEQTVDLFDGLKVLVDDKAPTTYSVAAGANIIDAVRAVLTGAGIPASAVAIVDSPATVSVAMVWEAGTTRLRIANDLLDAANYFALVHDDYGVYTASPYSSPAQRPTRWEFFDGEASIYEPEFEHEEDTFDVPNRVTVLGRSDGTTEALSAVATNDDPASPYSYTVRGRWIDREPETIEATDQATLDAIAARRLAEATQVARAVSLSHWLVPLALNDVVEFRNVTAGIDLRGVVASRGVSLDADGLATATARIREVQA